MKTSKLEYKSLTFDSQGLQLEGELCFKPPVCRSPAVVVCHPHPLYGGSMHNNVVDSLCECLATNGIIALKFNFRGVEKSQGVFDNGRGEQDDVKAALEFLYQEPAVETGRLGLAGYSAGAAWGLQALYADSRIKSMAAISPPLAMFDFSFLSHTQKPVFLISGDLDDFTPSAQIKRICKSRPDFLTYREIPQADHSWSGFESEMASAVSDFFLNRL